MTTDMVHCSLVAGVCGPALGEDDREWFVERLAAAFPRESAGDVRILRGKTSVVVFRAVGADAQKADDVCAGGGCVLRFGEIDPAAWESSLSLERVNGSWSAVTVDDARGMVVAARDGSGAEAFYFAEKNGGFWFANSLTLFRTLSLGIDRKAAADFLHFLYVPAPRTIYDGVGSLRPGWRVTFNGSRAEASPLPMPKECLPDPSEYQGTAEDLLERYERLLQDALKRGCSGTRKAALFLSGGKDSSGLAVACKLAGLGGVECVTLGFNHADIDESADAAMVARHLALKHRCLTFDAGEYRTRFPAFVSSMGQPLGDPAALPVFCAATTLKDEYDIFLDGTGNDSYFGIPTTWQEDVAWYAHRFVAGLNLLPWGVLADSSQYSVRMIAQRLAKRREEQFVSWNGWTGEEIAGLTGFCPDWRDTPLYGLYAEVHGPMENKTRTLCSIWEPEAAYRKTVQVAEHFGSLVRYPFLDREVVAWSYGLPSSLRMKGRTNKVILRMLLEKHLPAEIVTKRKGAFIFPKEYILAADAFSYLERYLSKAVLLSHGIVDPAAAEPVLRRYREGDRSVEDRVWSLLLLHAWLEERCSA